MSLRSSWPVTGRTWVASSLSSFSPTSTTTSASSRRNAARTLGFGQRADRVAAGHHQHAQVARFDLVDQRHRRLLTDTLEVGAAERPGRRRPRLARGGRSLLSGSVLEAHAAGPIERPGEDQQHPPQPLHQDPVGPWWCRCRTEIARRPEGADVVEQGLDRLGSIPAAWAARSSVNGSRAAGAQRRRRARSSAQLVGVGAGRAARRRARRGHRRRCPAAREGARRRGPRSRSGEGRRPRSDRRHAGGRAGGAPGRAARCHSRATPPGWCRPAGGARAGRIPHGAHHRGCRRRDRRPPAPARCRP